MAEAKSDFNPKEMVHGDPLELPRLACGAMAELQAVSGRAQPSCSRSDFPANWSRTGTTRPSRASANW